MASDLRLVIADPVSGTIVYEHWLGMSGTLRRVKEVLGRRAEQLYGGDGECWGRLTADQALAISEESYADGVHCDDIRRLASRFPDNAFWWMIDHDW